MKTIEQIAAEILVECGYAESWAINGNDDLVIGWIVSSDFDGSKWDVVDPFTDTLEGRRQADAIEDWLFVNRTYVWGRSANADTGGERHQWRLDRIKWCLEQLRNEDDE